jgi:hypothetical protein
MDPGIGSERSTQAIVYRHPDAGGQFDVCFKHQFPSPQDIEADKAQSIPLVGYVRLGDEKITRQYDRFGCPRGGP